MKKTIGPLFFLPVSILALLSAGALAQERPASIGKNYIAVQPGDTEADIIRKAATVTPSPRQLRWQELELTAFFHFGINTFTDREWGTGKDDIGLFILLLQEEIRVGQRIEAFVLEYQDGHEWKKIAEGTTVGYKRLLRFPAVKASRVRLRILSSRLTPVLAKFGLYKMAA